MKRMHKSGFTQYNNGDGWKFQISGFDSTYTGQSGYCSVLHERGTQTVRIDAKDRIEIDGQWYTKRHWEH